MQIEIGQVDADPRVLDKSGLMKNVRLLSVQIDRNCNVKKPVFLLNIIPYNVHANYCHVLEWDTYYFLGEPVIMDGLRCSVTGTLDPLTTYAGKIRDLHAYLIRTQSSDKSNKYIQDPRRPEQENRKCRTYDFNRTPFTANYAQDTCYILTVVGGSQA